MGAQHQNRVPDGLPAEDGADHGGPIGVNYLGTVCVTHAAVPGMLARGSGHIVNIPSEGGFLGVCGYTAYCGSKFAGREFSEAPRVKLKPAGVGVSVVFPSDTDTPSLCHHPEQ
jgi:3-dehydrosphinganine reductase